MVANKTSKQIYVNKYDYMHYYTRCKKVWFLSNKEIDEELNKIEAPLKKKLKINDNVDDDENDDDNHIDDYETLREYLLRNNLDDKKIYEIYDPRLLEGLIIDKKVKEFITDYYQKQKVIDEIIDFDELYKSLTDNQLGSNGINKDIDEMRAKQTSNIIRQFLNEGKTFILFQPTFINETTDEHAKYITRCDCIVYLGKDHCYLIEAKATSTSKYVHFLDLLYQKKVLTNSLLHITDYYLCLVGYARSKKGNIPFLINPFIRLTKDSPQLSSSKKQCIPLMFSQLSTEQDPKEFKTKLNDVDKIETNWKQEYKLGIHHLSINNALNNNLNFEFISLSYIVNGSTINYACKFINESQEKINFLINDFDKTINELYHLKTINHQIKKAFEPCGNCKSKYKNCDYWRRCKNLFKLQYWDGVKKLLPFGYSSYVFNKSQFKIYDDIDKGVANISDPNFVSTYVKPVFYSFFQGEGNNNDEFMHNVKDLWTKLQSKPNRVYFDFESINSVIPPIKDTFPLAQTITQNSIVKTEKIQNDSYHEYFADNMIRDPTNLTIDWLKQIIDELNDVKDAKHPANNCWFVVYNKTFESSRLHEIDLLIQEKEYHDKIEEIRNNIFDLQDFFNTKQEGKKLLINKLHGFYSIKDILPLIPNSIRQETKTVDYHQELINVHNGEEAQMITMRRFLNLYRNELLNNPNIELMTEEEWNKTAKNLQKYCENDVRAMIAVEKYIKEEFIDKLPKD